MASQSPRAGQAGQAIVILAVSVAVILAAAAAVLDGGNAMAQQRGTQNATDAAALAGATVIGQQFSGALKYDSDVYNAVSNAFAVNSSAMGNVYYVDFSLTQVGKVGAGGSIPSTASGVEASGTRTFNTFLASLIGQPTWTAGASATALAGQYAGGCSADVGCATLPVVFSIPLITCDGTNQPLYPLVQWSLIGDPSQATAANEAIIPLCTTGPGGVGWITMPGCAGNLSQQVWPPCGDLTVPSWVQITSGNMNNVQTVINTHYVGSIVLIPMFDATCRDVPSSGQPADCTDPGNGTNLYYHIPFVLPFLLDHAYLTGSNISECNQAPGQPFVGGNGSTGCFKGWFVNEMLQGHVIQFNPCDPTSGDCPPPIIGTQLVQ